MAEGVLFDLAASLIEMLGLWRTTNYSASKTTSKRVICEGKHNLHSLTLQCNILEDNEMAIERLQPPSNLKVLHMSHFEGVRLGGWDSSLNNLVKLELNLCGQCQYLPKLDQLRYLEELRIKWVGAEYMCSSGEDDDFDANLFFPSLVTLQIEDCYNLKWWWWKKEVDGNNIRSFPRLSNLSIYHCSHLTSMPLFPSIENVRLYKTSSMALKDTFKMMRGSKAHNTHPNISLLRSMDIEHCPDLTSLLVEGIDNLPSLRSVSIRHCRNLTSVLEGIDNLPSLESIRIYNCPNLTSLLEGIDNLPSLEFINIADCPNLTSIPDSFRRVGNSTIWGCPKLEQR
ncbi:hypothetical protein G4B88_020374 [Cannabis sativa]|uniref:R13L1/DRL21-like LRR repeat region domain-containing protein n=1 Tax=Cannabis sativa TaxID=3483 RepID=A0A7J6EN74_CANSA|nr:hypothetical protein G4B88_020374 [Cannabis sativa]